MRRAVFAALAFTLLPATHAQAATSASLPSGSTISIAKSTFSKTTYVTVNGKNFDETIGIYLAYCLVPRKGKAPTPCGGGVNKAGTGEASYWISSNPPPYGIGLAIPYLAGGRFAEKVKVTRMLGKYDCKKVTCAITVRSDHLHEGDRTHDIFIPITFK